jgi:hypothetical protein
MYFYKRKEIMKKINLKTYLLPLCLLSLASSCQIMTNKTPERPSVAEKDLVIYEIATKGFTSPEGAESGTFNSLKKKIPYLSELGINAVWLTGHSLADGKHFYNIWTQYACIEPDKLDSSLGTSEEFKSMIDEFHKHGIKVFLDVITHGVVKGAPLIKQHPEWFQAGGTKGSWGMIDYKWKNAPEGLLVWWEKLWTDMVLKYGVDGFRLDCNARRPEIWRKIKKTCKKKNIDVTIFNESTLEKNFADTITFAQGYRYYRNAKELDKNQALSAPELVINPPKKNSHSECLRSLQLSCHDSGWGGFPLDKNPYMVQGSRWIFGYAGVFLPSIVIMMSGEEFDCSYRPLPNLASSLFHAKNIGRGRWLYGSWIDWSQLENPKKRAMLEDAKKMLNIRKKYSYIIHSVPIGEKPNLKTLKAKAVNDFKEKFPPPYIQWNENSAILVVANPSVKMDLSLKINIDTNLFGEIWQKSREVEVTDLWNSSSSPLRITTTDLKNFQLTVKKDKTPGGGIAVFHIQPVKISPSY